MAEKRVYYKQHLYFITIPCVYSILLQLALVVLENNSIWFKRALESLRSAGKEERPPASLPTRQELDGPPSSSSPEICPQGWITLEFAEFAVSALNYSAKKAEEDSKSRKVLSARSLDKQELQNRKTSITERCSRPGDLRRKRKVPDSFSEFRLNEASVNPTRKNVAKKYVHRGALNNKSSGVGEMFHEKRRFLEDELFLNLELPKLVEEEKMRASDGTDIDLTIRASDHQKIQLVAWIRFRNLYHSGKIHIRVLSRKSSPIMLVCIAYLLQFDR